MLRKPCIGNCGREVLVKLGAECRKCRKKRLHAGLKRVKSVERANKGLHTDTATPIKAGESGVS